MRDLIESSKNEGCDKDDSIITVVTITTLLLVQLVPVTPTSSTSIIAQSYCYGIGLLGSGYFATGVTADLQAE